MKKINKISLILFLIGFLFCQYQYQNLHYMLHSIRSFEDEVELDILVELTIKGVTETVPLHLEIKRLAEELVQIKGKLEFSRTAFKIGIGKWSSTAILKDNASIETDLFLFRE